jgi:hypothetical protein
MTNAKTLSQRAHELGSKRMPLAEYVDIARALVPELAYALDIVTELARGHKSNADELQTKLNAQLAHNAELRRAAIHTGDWDGSTESYPRVCGVCEESGATDEDIEHLSDCGAAPVEGD